MSTKCKVIYTLLMNIPVALAISLTAQFLAIKTVVLPLLGINFCLAYGVSFVVGMLLPIAKWGVGFAFACKAAPNSLKFGLLVNVVINFVYVLINEIILSYFNIVILGHAPMMAYVMGILTTFIPIYIVGYIVSFIWNRPAEKIAKNVCNEV